MIKTSLGLELTFQSDLLVQTGILVLPVFLEKLTKGMYCPNSEQCRGNVSEIETSREMKTASCYLFQKRFKTATTRSAA